MGTVFKGRYIGGTYGIGSKLKRPASKLHRQSNVNDSDFIQREQRTDDVTRSDLMLAATLIRDAMHGRHCDFKMDPDSVKSYNSYNSRVCQWTTYLAIFLILILAIFEKPAVVEAPLWATVAVETLCLVVFIGRHLHRSLFETDFWKSPKNLTMMGVLVLTWLDIIAYVVLTFMAPRFALRLSRPLRVMFLLYFSEGRQLKAFRNIRLTLADIANVLCLVGFCLVVFSLMAFKLFGKRNLKYANGSGYFTDFAESLWELFLLVTTANFPDIMMPAYDNNNAFALFFVLYIVVNNYVFMSILLAIIYNNYRRHLKEEVRHFVFQKRRLLGRAFDIMKTWRQTRYVIVKHDWYLLMKFLVPKYSKNHVEVLMHVLDENGDGCIERREFLNVADLLSVRLTEVHQRLTCLEKIAPILCHSWLADTLRFAILHRCFRYFFDACIVANAICIAVDYCELESVFLGIFLAEIFLNIFALGCENFFTSPWNIFDFFVIFSAFITEIVVFLGQASAENLELLLILRVVRLGKLAGTIPRFGVVVTTITSILPSLLTYISILLTFYYVYAIIGMELFHGLIRFETTHANASDLFCGNSLLNGSSYISLNYCANNFNDILKAFVVLFELMYVNNWNVLTEGFVVVTNTWARLYFVSFHLLCVLLILNIFVAFILEAFILEYTVESGKIESWVERKIKEMGLSDLDTEKRTRNNGKIGLVHQEDNAGKETSFKSDSAIGSDFKSSEDSEVPEYMENEGLQFHLEKKSRKTFLVLLQAMFENELEHDKLGIENLELMGY